MAWGSKEFQAKSKAVATGDVPVAVTGQFMSGALVGITAIAPGGSTVTINGGTAAADATNAAIEAACASGGVISAAIDAAITAHVAAYQHTPAE